MLDLVNSPLFPLEELSPETFVKLPKHPHAESKSVKVYIILAENHLFLEGFTKEEVTSRPPVILRGCLFIRIAHPVKIKEISLKLKGTARTEWPEGIPPKKVEHFEAKGIINHTWPFFNYVNSYPTNPTQRNNADLYIPKSDSDVSNFSLDSTLSPVNSLTDLKPTISPVSILKSFRSPSSHSVSAHSNDLHSVTSNPGNDANKYFPPGDYIYSFEMPIQCSSPESVNVTFGSINYELEAHVERSGAFKSSLTARRPLSLVRAPFENSSEENEPIIINRDWEDKLQYDIVIYSKQVVLNSYLPISFRMIPLEKIKIHRLRVYITEHLEYYSHNKKVHRTEPPKKILLLEHKPIKPLDNLLSLSDDEIGGVELDFQVFIPELYDEIHKLHPDTTSEDIQSHHWMKICIRISKADPTPEDPNKRKQYELSIDSPMHLLSPLCVHANTLLPSYDEQLKIDKLNMDLETSRSTTETASVKTATPQLNSLGKKQCFDKMMKPRNDTILISNLFKPDSTVPIEMLSPQAKPFSPIASPQLNAINPELRDTPTIRSLNLSPIASPTRSRSASRSSAISRALSPMSTSRVPLPGMVRLSSTSSIHEAPPPPFIENPPTYEEATIESRKNNRRGETTSSSLSLNTLGSESSIYLNHSNHSSNNSTSSFTAKNKDSNNNSKSSSNIPTRISLNLASSSSQKLNTLQLPRLNSSTTLQSSTPVDYTPSISSFLDPHTDEQNEILSSRSNSNYSVSGGGQIRMINSSSSLSTAARGGPPVRGRLRDLGSSDLAEDSNLQFKITPIRSPSVSPYLKPINTENRSISPIRSASPAPIIATSRNLNKLISSSFTPGFSINDKINQNISNFNFSCSKINPSVSNSTEKSILANMHTAGNSDLDTIIISDSLSPEDTSSLDKPLLQSEGEEGNDEDDTGLSISLTNDLLNSSELSNKHNVYSNAFGSTNSLDDLMMLQNNNSISLLDLPRGSLSGPSLNVASENQHGISLNYLGNNVNDIDDLNDNVVGTDITNMGTYSEPSGTIRNKLRNPNIHPNTK